MELSPFILVAFIGVAVLVEKIRSRREKRALPENVCAREYTPEQRRAYIKIYNEFFM